MSAFFSSTSDGTIAGGSDHHQTTPRYTPRSHDNVEEYHQNTSPRNVSRVLITGVQDASIGSEDSPEQLFEVAPRLGRNVVVDENCVLIASVLHNESEDNITILASNNRQEDDDSYTPTNS